LANGWGGGQIDLRLAPALKPDHQLAGGQAETFDFAFIDADKVNYEGYYERSLQLVRPGGLIVIDNVLWFGRVADPRIKTATIATPSTRSSTMTTG